MPAGPSSSWSSSRACRSPNTVTRADSAREGSSYSSRSARRSSTPIRKGSSIATSSRRTCSSTLIDAQAVPKVIDFGVAKAIDQRLTEKTLFTQFGSIVGTLEYMSPEQAELSGMDVDTRSDVYALGVLLYELLTGTTPLEQRAAPRCRLRRDPRRIKEEEPPKPSTRLSGSGERLALIAAVRGTEPARLTRAVRGDLDWIVMKALEKSRTRRYESAGGFARDVQRYLDNDAVEACPPSAGYRLRKFGRKHRASVAVASAFAGLVVAAAGISIALAVRRPVPSR